MKRIMSAVLSVALVFGLAVMPVGAAGGKVTVTCPKEKSIPELETTGYGEALFINGRLNVHNKKTDLYGYIGTDGSLVIPCIYKQANPFQNGVAIVQKDGLFGLIATDGKAIVAPQ
ncbi:MAG: WG repeat-containing protein, partial [Oscillospiraceae bacterium]